MDPVAEVSQPNHGLGIRGCVTEPASFLLQQIDSEYSPFSSFIGTNYLLNSDEAIRIKEYIAKQAARIAEVDQGIEDLRDLRAKLTLDIENHRSLLSPISYLPIDILQEIFAACLPTEHNPVMSQREAPLLLTQVCKDWRSIMFSTPYLWSAIHIPIPSFPRHITAYDIEYPAIGQSKNLSPVLTVTRGLMTVIHQWLERSKSSPISISVYDSGNCPTEVCDLVLDTIIHFSPRWKRLVFDTHACDLTRIAGLLPSRVPQLESFSVRNGAISRLNHAADLQMFGAGPVTHLSPVSWSASSIVNAPNLREIAFHQMSDIIVELPLRWSQMTVIFLGSINATQMFSTPPISLKQVSFILRSCPELMSFRLEVILFDDGFEQNPQHISLPCLQSFSLYDSGIDVSSLFSILELPSLKYLEFNSNAQHLERSALEMLLPRIITLERLTTEPQFFSQGYYLKCLNHMTSLTHISIKRPPHVRAPIGEDLNGYYKIVSDSLLEWFTTPDPAGDYPVPNLETFECYAASEFTDNAVVDFIRKKHALPGIRALKKISISFSRAPTVDIVQEIGKAISSQLDPYLTYPFAMESSYDRVGFHPFAGICPSSTAR